MNTDTTSTSLGVCMSVLIDSISEPLGVAEQPLDATTDTANSHASDPSPRLDEDDMNEASTEHRRVTELGGQEVRATSPPWSGPRWHAAIVSFRTLTRCPRPAGPLQPIR